MLKSYELRPVTSQKSFYGKAVVIVGSDGAETLYSYNTPIIKRFPDGTLKKLWSGWSATTGKHINAFCGLNKKEFSALPYEGAKETGGGQLLTNNESYNAMMARRNAR